jgi:hypothetical protein
MRNILTTRELAEQLAREARYGAWEPAVERITAALDQERQAACAAFMDAWIARVGERIPVEDIALPEVHADAAS